MGATLKSRLPFIAAELRPRVSAAIKESAEEIEGEARRRVPVATGRLQDAIHTRRTGPAQYAVVAGDDGAFYGHMVERGTKFMDAQPFLVPAAEAHEEAAIDSVTLVLRSL